jgi:hypothetical protein
VLGDAQANLGQIEQLPRAVADLYPSAQITVAASTNPGDMIDHPIWDSDLFQMLAAMARLAARLAARRPPQALGWRLGQSV